MKIGRIWCEVYNFERDEFIQSLKDFGRLILCSEYELSCSKRYCTYFGLNENGIIEVTVPFLFRDGEDIETTPEAFIRHVKHLDKTEQIWYNSKGD